MSEEIRNETSAGAASSSRLRTVQAAQYRRTRWFGIWMIVAGLVVIPIGLSIPWELPVRIAIIAVVGVVLVAMSLYARSRGVIPRSSLLVGAAAAWLGLSVLLAAVLGEPGFTVGFIAAAAASVPFFVVGAYVLARRAGKEEPSV